MSWLTLLLTFAQAIHATYPPKRYDYVIVGGGPAGLVVANRLSANQDVSVAVIEAGDSAYNNPNVSYVPKSITEYGLFIGTSIDWKYMTAPQKYVSNNTMPYWAGKALGGSTTINGMTYLRAEQDQIDAWEELGNEGWNWDSMLEYYIAQEGFQIPDEKTQEKGAIYDDDVHGKDGELAVGFTPYLAGQGFSNLLKETSEANGYPDNSDANDGNMRGFNTWPMTLNLSGPVRADAARAFYFPVAESRPNLHVFLNTTAKRIIWEEKNVPADAAIANGVNVVAPGCLPETIHATKEVIVAAGSIKSPAFLEHSGIGNPAILEPLGIEVITPLHTVGSNLPDQPQNGIIYASSTNWTGYPTFVSYLTASDLFGDELPAIAKEVRANLTSYAKTIVSDYAHDTISLAVQEKLLKHQVDLVFTPSSTIPLAEILFAPTGNQIIAQLWNLLPFSRGSIHINSSNPELPPSMDPNFLQLPIDMYVQAAAAIRVREYFATSPLVEHVTGEMEPGFETVPEDAGWRDEAWASFIKKGLNGNSHPVSTCAMMSQEMGGVVDVEGKVYGTKNVRVVDASIFPTQISGHLSASVYAIAGKIADAILKS